MDSIEKELADIEKGIVKSFNEQNLKGILSYFDKNISLYKYNDWFYNSSYSTINIVSYWFYSIYGI